MASAKSNGIIYLNTNFFDIYITGMTNALRFQFAPEVVQDMEIISRDILLQQLDTFVTTNKLPPANILILLADPLLFCKELPPGSEFNTTRSEEMQTFLDAVPFEHVVNKLYKLEKKEILVATNQAFQDIFQEVFSKQHSRVDSVVPVFLLGKTVDLTNGMPKQLAKTIIDKLSNIKPWSLPVMHEVVQSPIELTTETKELSEETDVEDLPQPSLPKKKKNNRRTIIMSSMLVPLLIVMVVMYNQMNAENAKNDALVKAKQQALQASQPSPTISQTAQTALPPSPPASAFSATTDEQNLQIAIQYTASSATLAASVKTELTSFGIKTVTTTQVSTPTTPQSTAIFTSKVPASSKQRIIDELHKNIANIIIQDSAQLSVDILVSLP